MSELTSRVQAALENRLPTLPPGALPTPLIEGATPAEMLASAMKTMSEAERRAGQVSIELVEGTLGTEVRSVELLRLGGLAAWWSSLDGTEGGTATMRDGKLSLELASDGTVQQAISQAIRIARGRAAPSLVTLPYQPISVGREVGQ
ncbi:MAG: DUF3450 family protein [Myxococcota bacterium]|nr:DUF3450 family protein [Myxococcota bacterium]